MLLEGERCDSGRNDDDDEDKDDEGMCSCFALIFGHPK